MTFLHLGLLLASIACIALVDARYRLFFWRAPLRATVVVAVGVATLLAWDLWGISLGIFFREPNAYSTGLLIAPHLPIEEPVFLAFLCQLAMVGYTGLLRVLAHRAADRPADSAAEGVRR
ncbi:lycopene cyclase domain-containing protein [Agromyces soli]|uniref:Lycopene cyclase domain-containing protein n=1 Tax=Agromyces soli TaxID=659012 RepID=A0ABY4AUT1_9MICO|nr:lycopene cyclase domain-containing protein [Agromyces soli]UOE26937.1 lycopene cyclase domain-containing protein [Agromyces soli]